jgi:hypothetical protein
MGLRHLVAATTLALLGATLQAGPADAREVGQRAAPRDGDHFPVTVTTDVPPNGTSMVTTPTIPKDARALTVTVKPKNPTPLQKEDYDNFVNTVGSLSKGKRLLVCTMLYQSIVTPQNAYTGDFEVDGYFATLAGAVLLACLKYAGLLGAGKVGARAAADKCGQVRPSLPAVVTKVEGGYQVEASGASKKARKPKLKIRCTTKGTTVRYTIRPAKKGQTLRKAAGKKIMVGLKSPADAQGSVPVQVRFSRP